jgi:hypothetical protein
MKRSLLLLALVALPCSAQVRTFSIDARPIGATITLGWRAAAQTYIGLGLGGGTDELGITLRPRDKEFYRDFGDYLHLDLFVRHKPRSRFDFDFGLRGGIGEVRDCRSSDCLPGVFAGAYAGVFAGSARWKLGTRLIAARVVQSSDERDNVVHWEVITLRYTR